MVAKTSNEVKRTSVRLESIGVFMLEPKSSEMRRLGKEHHRMDT